MLKHTNLLTKVYGIKDGHTLAVYEREARGYEAAKKVLTSMTREQVVDEAKKANIRGRGGAGFPMGIKWSFMRPHPTKPAYLVLNADEGEPGTHKDRTLMEQNPHAVIEGCIIGCYGIGAHTAYIYVRDELHLSKARLNDAIKEARAKGYLGAKPFGKDYAVDVHVHTGAGARRAVAAGTGRQALGLITGTEQLLAEFDGFPAFCRFTLLGLGRKIDGEVAHLAFIVGGNHAVHDGIDAFRLLSVSCFEVLHLLEQILGMLPRQLGIGGKRAIAVGTVAGNTYGGGNGLATGGIARRACLGSFGSLYAECSHRAQEGDQGTLHGQKLLGNSGIRKL